MNKTKLFFWRQYHRILYFFTDDVKVKSFTVDAYKHVVSRDIELKYKGKSVTLVTKIKVWYVDDIRVPKSKALKKLLRGLGISFKMNWKKHYEKKNG